MFLLAKQDDMLAAIIGAVVIVLVCVVPIMLLRARRRAQREAALDSETLKPGEVRVIFHTYSGFLVWVTQRRYNVVAPAEQAKEMLRGWWHHNLTWGLLAYGGPIVPMLSWFEYRAQMKKINAASEAQQAA